MERSLFRNNNVISFWEVIKDPETNIADIMFGIDEKYSVKEFVFPYICQGKTIKLKFFLVTKHFKEQILPD